MFVLCVEMANSANTNTVVRTWFGGRRGLRSGGSNGRTGRGWGRRRLPASTLLGRPRGRRRFPPPASGGAGRGAGRGGAPRARGGAEGGGAGGAWGRLGAVRAAEAVGPGRARGRGPRPRPPGGRAGGEPPLAPVVGPAALAGEGLPEQSQNKNRAWGIGRIPKSTVIHFNAVEGSWLLWGLLWVFLAVVL